MKKGPYASHRQQYKAAIGQLAEAPIVCVFGDCEFLVNRVKGQLEQRLAKQGYLVEAKAEQQAFKENWQDWLSARGLFQSQIAYSVAVKGDAKLKAALTAIKGPEDTANKVILACGQKSLAAGITKQLSRLGAVQISCKEPYANEASAVIGDLAKAEKLNLDQRAIAALASHLGPSPALVANELAKLALIFSGQPGPHSADAIAPHIGAIKEDQAFTLEKLLLNGKIAEAQLLVHQLLAKGDAPLMVLAILTGFFRKMHSLHLCAAHERAGVLSSLRVPPFAHRDYFSALPRYSEPLCGRLLARCQAADLTFKSSPADPAVVLSHVVLTAATG